MRVLAIGDIHGCSRALDTLLAAVAPRPDDLLITLGDYVDRGPDSRGVLDRLLRIRQTGRLVALRGNHDLMMVSARASLEPVDGWLACGGRETLVSYGTGGTLGRFEDVPDEHWEFLEKGCVDWYETETHLFVHANADPNLPLSEQPDYLLFWEPLGDPKPHHSGKIIVCGHTRQLSGEPLDLGFLICVDTWVYGQGWLTCLDVGTGQIWQANQLGQKRTAWLQDQGTYRWR